MVKKRMSGIRFPYGEHMDYPTRLMIDTSKKHPLMLIKAITGEFFPNA